MTNDNIETHAQAELATDLQPVPVEGAGQLTVDQALLLWNTCPDWLATALGDVLARQDALANLIVGTELRALELAVYGLADRIQKVELALIETETVMTRARDSRQH